MACRFVIVRRSESLPLYHPYFVNYGRNRDEYFARVREAGFDVSVMSQEYLFELPARELGFGSECHVGRSIRSTTRG